MTTTKEEQMRAAFRKLHPNSEMQEQFAEGWKACAESCEKKLAEKDADIAAISHLYENEVKKRAEANARNARLVEALKVAQRHLHHGITRAEHDEIDGAISANSEATQENEK